MNLFILPFFFLVFVMCLLFCSNILALHRLVVFFVVWLYLFKMYFCLVLGTLEMPPKRVFLVLRLLCFYVNGE